MTDPRETAFLLLHVGVGGTEVIAPDPFDGRPHLRLWRRGDREFCRVRPDVTPPGRGWLAGDGQDADGSVTCERQVDDRAVIMQRGRRRVW